MALVNGCGWARSMNVSGTTLRTLTMNDAAWWVILKGLAVYACAHDPLLCLCQLILYVWVWMHVIFCYMCIQWWLSKEHWTDEVLYLPFIGVGLNVKQKESHQHFVIFYPLLMKRSNKKVHSVDVRRECRSICLGRISICSAICSYLKFSVKELNKIGKLCGNW